MAGLRGSRGEPDRPQIRPEIADLRPDPGSIRLPAAPSKAPPGTRRLSGLLLATASTRLAAWCVMTETLQVVRQEAVVESGLTSQLHRHLDLFVEKFVKIGDEILGWALLYDVTDLVRQIHRFEGRK